MEQVRRLLETGCTAAQASRETGVPVSTIVRWRRGLTATFGAPVSPVPWRPPDAWSYAYLLGVYLGDGHVAVRDTGRCWLRLLSADIRRLFCEACDRLDVRWTQSNARNVSVADRRSVAILERVVGPKA
jgi:hypothetical protein